MSVLTVPRLRAWELSDGPCWWAVWLHTKIRKAAFFTLQTWDWGVGGLGSGGGYMASPGLCGMTVRCLYCPPAGVWVLPEDLKRPPRNRYGVAIGGASSPLPLPFGDGNP